MIFSLEKVIDTNFSYSQKSKLIRLFDDREYDSIKQDILNKIKNHEYYMIDNSVYYTHVKDKNFIFSPDPEMTGCYIGYLVHGNESKMTLSELLFKYTNNKYQLVK